MALEIRELPEVVVMARNYYSRRDVDFFWFRVLGVKPSRSGLEVLNPEKVYFYRNSDNVLKVSCREPIEIVNHEMGYHIRYVLKTFEHDYRNDITTFYGTPYFEELTPQNSRQRNNWEKKRHEEYAVSLTRFLRALYREQIHEEGFILTTKDSVLYAKTAFPLKDILQADQEKVHVNIESPLLLACVSKPVTAQMIENTHNTIFDWNETFPILILNPQQITVYSDGTFTGVLCIEELRNSITGLSAMLPIDYESLE